MDKLVGAGYTSSGTHVTESDVYEKWNAPAQFIHFDNVYISILVDFGLIGVICVLIIIWRAVVAVIKRRDECGMAIIGLIPAVAFWDPIYCPVNMILFSPLCGVVLADDAVLVCTYESSIRSFAMGKAIVTVCLCLSIAQVGLLILKLVHVISWPMIYVLLPAFGIFALGVLSLIHIVIKAEEG